MRLSARWAPTTLLLLLVPLLTGANGADATDGPARDLVPVQRADRAIPGEYIVTVKPAFAPDAVVRQLGVTPLHTYGTALRGFAARLSASQLRTVRTLPAVRAVEENAEVGLGLPPASGTRSAARVPAASWGLDRIDQRYLPLDGQYDVTGTGRGVTAYVVDTGIETAHSEFEGRATVGFDAVNDGRNGQDCHGHGTHVAGTVGGKTYGVAREVSLVAVRVLDCTGDGSTAEAIAGFDWVASHATQPAVLNASIGGPVSPALDSAANGVADAGVLPVAAAGNSTVDACDASPARANKVLTVGATDRNDQEAYFSNFGPCLSLYAPGVGIVSAKLGGGSTTLSGTSMASPHAAGVAALYEEAYPDAAPQDVARWIISNATEDVVSPIHPNSPNLLLHTDGL
ncbi:S8 family peptidase [Streptomyces sp. NPDC093109]|uniref:S8 family peptidase n=1 Tax=Streptomyces sp. NPDC093109 TaxID=3154977 RepID=UPI00345025CE